MAFEISEVAAALNALGIGNESELSEYNSILDTDIGQLVQYQSFHFLSTAKIILQSCVLSTQISSARMARSLPGLLMPLKQKKRAGSIQTE